MELADLREAYIAAANVLHELRVNFRLFDDFLQQRVDEIIELGIFESSLEALGKRCSDRKSNHNIISILRCADNER
jgi:dsRNA-specific ribonuclease